MRPPLLGDVVPGCPQSETGRGVILSKRSATKDLAPGAGSDSGASMDIRTSPRLCRRGGGLSPPGGIGDKQEKGSANSQHLRIRRSFLPSYDPGVRGPPRASRRARNIPTREKRVTFQALLRRSKLCCDVPSSAATFQALLDPYSGDGGTTPPSSSGRNTLDATSPCTGEVGAGDRKGRPYGALIRRFAPPSPAGGRLGRAHRDAPLRQRRETDSLRHGEPLPSAPLTAPPEGEPRAAVPARGLCCSPYRPSATSPREGSRGRFSKRMSRSSKPWSRKGPVSPAASV